MEAWRLFLWRRFTSELRMLRERCRFFVVWAFLLGCWRVGEGVFDKGWLEYVFSTAAHPPRGCRGERFRWSWDRDETYFRGKKPWVFFLIRSLLI
ncbi:MAG: hypothetical protein D6805_01830 [Planctomycetota bacterium]|nr:MAG: hypothetical protein D6805_01830 [Planctomycetota bacterium]